MKISRYVKIENTMLKKPGEDMIVKLYHKMKKF